MSAVLKERPTSWWEDGSPRSTDNGFCLCYDGRPHGFVPGAPMSRTRAGAPATSNRSERAFGGYDGVIPGMGRD